MEAKYNVLSASLRDIIFAMQFIDKLVSWGVKLLTDKPKVHCRVFEENRCAVEFAKASKLRPCTKHIVIQYLLDISHPDCTNSLIPAYYSS